MDYKEKYEKALVHLKKFIDGDCVCDSDILADFPELRESEDERMRKLIIDRVRSATEMTESLRDLLLTYLEKQKEQKSISAAGVLARAGLKPYKDGNQWCILVGDNIQEGICGFGDTIDEALYQFLMEVLEKQKEQKPIKVYDNMDDLIADAMIDEISKSDMLDNAKHNRIYWINKHRQNPAWSEEDEEEIIYTLLGIIDSTDSIPFINGTLRISDERKKELKEFIKRRHWKPSRAQMSMLLAVINEPNNASSESCHLALAELYEELKKLCQ